MNNEINNKDMSVNPMLLSPLYDKSGRTTLNSSSTFYKANPLYTSSLDQQLQKIRLEPNTPLPIDLEFQKLSYQTQTKNDHVLSWMNESDLNKDFIHFNYKQIIHDLKNENNDQSLVKLIQALRLEMPEIDENLILNDLAEDENEDFGYELLRKKYSVNNSLKPEMKQMIPTSPEKEYIKDEVFKRTNVAVAIARQKNNYPPSSLTNDTLIMNSFPKNLAVEKTIQNDNNLSINNYKTFITKDTSPRKTQQTPIIKNKRHNRKPTNEDYIKMQTIKPHPPLTSVMKKVKEKTGITNSEEELKEYYQAFTSKPRIARTPIESVSLNSLSTTSKTTLPEIKPNSSSFNHS
ncbi:hypothetical protein PIROE2DRAFT_58777 [Piromyces sp. E2]|nr:hypothetical protein PIROE2DRAFT_58777 [Piromyces sp. E2]|eukprot:OUM67481.1 hypothetical protein PIROE2DRAFT_58777 [Piromyces sp. E2]